MIGLCIGNNAASAHSILYGMTAEHIFFAEVVFADGSTKSNSLIKPSIRIVYFFRIHLMNIFIPRLAWMR
jgi:hypothetical protein